MVENTKLKLNKYQLAELEKRREALKIEKARLKHELPHLYGFKWYRWARAFFESTNRMNLLTAGNQLTKSSTLIRKNIHWATAKNLWPKLWPKHPNPRQFWYLYPSADTATAEFQQKWVPEFMPKCGQFIGEKFKEECIHPVYGWKAIYDKKKIVQIVWTSGVTIYFHAYTKDVMNLQASSVHMISADEELPEAYYSELTFRRAAVDGYWNMVFTATRNQMLWMLAMEGEGELEKFPNAFKLQVGARDCFFYEDGSEGHMNEAKVRVLESECKSQAEIDRRVNGKFVTEIGRKYPTFDPRRHFVKPFAIPKNYTYYGAVDPGSGGAGGHPTGMGIIAVSPDYRKGYVIRGWRGDGIDTTAGDALNKFLDLRGDLPMAMQIYDQGCKDFFTIASRIGESFTPADKSHETGENVIGTLFKNDMLYIFDTPELRKLGIELLTVMKNTPKRQCKDDLIDGALRYPATSIPWDWGLLQKLPSEEEISTLREKAKQRPKTEEELKALEIDRRRGDYVDERDKEDSWDIFEEYDYWNEDAYG